MKFPPSMFPRPKKYRMAPGAFAPDPSEAVKRLVEALGLGGRPVKHLRIDAPAGGPVEVRAILLVDDDQAGAMAEVFKEYRLVEHGPPAGGGA